MVHIGTGLLIAGTQALAVGVLLMLVAKRFRDRPISGGHTGARNAFVLWWALVGSVSVLWGLQLLAAAGGIDALALHTTAMRLEILCLAGAFWGLSFYVLYLWTGETWVRWPLAVVAAGTFVAFDYLLTALRPVGIELTAWGLQPVLARQPEEEATLLLGAFVALLTVGLMAAYLVLLRFVRSAEHRFRVLSLGGGVLAWVVLTVTLGVLSQGDGTPGPVHLAVNTVFVLFLYATQVHSGPLLRLIARERSTT